MVPEAPFAYSPSEERASIESQEERLFLVSLIGMDAENLLAFEATFPSKHPDFSSNMYAGS